jgi:hypothetical protein
VCLSWQQMASPTGPVSLRGPSRSQTRKKNSLALSKRQFIFHDFQQDFARLKSTPRIYSAARRSQLLRRTRDHSVRPAISDD